MLTKEDLITRIVAELANSDILDFNNFCKAEDCLMATYNIIAEILERYMIFENDIMGILDDYRLK